jgi:hypothetical protein
LDFVEKRAVCASCFSDGSLVPEEAIKPLNVYYYNYLKRYRLLQLCEGCFKKSYSLFLDDIDSFLDWLDENDNRSDEDEAHYDFTKLRSKFNLSLELLDEDPDQYLENLEKYTVFLENKILSESIKI